IIKAMYEKPTGNIILNGKKLRAFPLRLRTQQGCPLSPLLLKKVLEVLASAIRQQKEKSFLNWQRSQTLTLCRYDMILYVENPKDSSPKLLELI
uniref:Reverse transcriptase domain-containing protein n=1 Tax=Neovison vison TaxID=452646 RepID=A0A8C7BZP3_NEOVI